MNYKIKYPKIKYFDEETRVPDYIIIKTDCENIRINYTDAQKYIKECEENNKFYVKIHGEFDYVNVHIDNINEAFKPKNGLGYKIKDKLLRNKEKICIGAISGIAGILTIMNVQNQKKIENLEDEIENLEEELEEVIELANDPSNAGRVLRNQRK